MRSRYGWQSRQGPREDLSILVGLALAAACKDADGFGARIKAAAEAAIASP
ncbi:hypothetical protein ACF07V_06000 [Streptomyces sp. NPDC015661]|uniref:hypothetical protein n=1 Tax=Streptomyces sp. NPDC015661 TaxID=3364961 RepID=UPI0036FF47E7